MRVLSIHVQRTLEISYGNLIGGGIAKLIAAFIMGRRGFIHREEGDADDFVAVDIDIDDDSLNSVNIFRRLLGNRKRQKGMTRRDKAAIDQILEATEGDRSLQHLRDIFLPIYLMPLVDHWKEKITERNYSNAGLVWKLFTDTNYSAFVQHLFPTPSTKGRYAKITSTCLAAIFTLYIQ